MIKMSVGLIRLPGLTTPEFLDYWHNRHALLVRAVAATLGIRRYVQLHPLAEGSGLLNTQPAPFDGVAEIWFDDISAIRRHREPQARAAMQKLKDDEKCFIDQSRSTLWWGTEQVIIQDCNANTN